MPPSKSMDQPTFLAHLRASGLLDPTQFEQVVRSVPPAPRGRHTARWLVERGILTRFQAELLLSGRSEGFVLGQYRILDQIGRGGMGRVFKAEHITMHRVVALKVLSSQALKTKRARQLFQREVRAAAKLAHPNIVTAFDANQIGDRAFLVMEYVNGPNLQDLVAERGPLPVAQACDFVRQAALGLQHAHEQGMVHRDIKPANLLVQQTPGRANAYTVKILDFGLARLNAPEPGKSPQGNESILTPNNTVMGTPDYLSPEQARSMHAVDIRSDIYSLGCTFYYLLTGSVPFPGGSSLEKMVRHTTEEPTPPEQFRSDIPPVVSAVLRRMLAKDPAMRFQTPIEVAQALEPYCGSGTGTWLAVTPPTASLPASDAQQSPWENLLDEDEATVATMPGGGPLTPTNWPADPAPARSRRVGRSAGGIILLVAAGFALLIGTAAVYYLFGQSG